MIDLSRNIQKLSKSLPLILLAGIFGGLVGLLMFYLQGPIYRGYAVVGIWIDPSRSALLNEQTEYNAYLRVQDLLLSDETLERTLSQVSNQAFARDVPKTVAELRDLIRLTRQSERWKLEVYSGDPAFSMQIAEAWANSSVVELEEATTAAWRAYEQQQAIFGIGCLPDAIENELPSYWVCSFAEIEREEVGDLLSDAGRSRGILPVMSFSLLEAASSDSTPIVRGRGTLTLAGTLIGILLALGLLLFWPRKQVRME